MTHHDPKSLPYRIGRALGTIVGAVTTLTRHLF